MDNLSHFTQISYSLTHSATKQPKHRRLLYDDKRGRQVISCSGLSLISLLLCCLLTQQTSKQKKNQTNKQCPNNPPPFPFNRFASRVFLYKIFTLNYTLMRGHLSLAHSNNNNKLVENGACKIIC